MKMILAALLALALVPPLQAQETAALPGDAEAWAAERERLAAPHAPDLSELLGEAILRAGWSVTTEPCAAPPETLRLYGLQSAHADRLVANGILAGAFHGGWTFYADTGCPETPVLRFLYVAETDGRHVLVVVNRGEVISTPSMMKETSAIAGADVYEAAKAREPGCDVETVGMRETAILDADPLLGPPLAGTRFRGGWTERWAFTACGRPAAATVRFDADGKGGSVARIQNVEVGD